MSVRTKLLLAIVCLGLMACVTVLGSLPGTFSPDAVGVGNMASSPDGKTLAFASDGQTIRLCDVATRKERASLRGIYCAARSLVLSPDGAILATWSDRTIQLWDTTTGEERAALEGHTDSVRSAAFSPDGKTLASASRDRTVKLWDVDAGKERAALKGHTSFVEAVAFSPDGKTLASASYDKTVKLWDIDAGKERATFRGHSYNVICLAFSPNGGTLASSGWDGQVRLWDVTTGVGRRLRAEWLEDDSEDYVQQLAFSRDGQFLAGTAWDRVGVWNVVSGRNTANFGRGLRPVDLSIGGVCQSLDLCQGGPWLTSLWFTPDGKLMGVGQDGQTVKRWELSTMPVKPGGVLAGFGVALLLAVLHYASRRFACCRTSPEEPFRPVVPPPSSVRRPKVAVRSTTFLVTMRDVLAIGLFLVVLALL